MKIMQIGRAEQQIIDLLDHDLFQDLSKHNPYFDSEHSLEADKLDECRMKLQLVHETLWNIVGMLENPVTVED